MERSAKNEMFENFIEQLQTATRNVASLKRDIVIVGSNNGVLLHDNILCPHWENLASAFQRRRREYFLYIRGVQLPKAVLNILLPALEKQHIVKLRLGRNNLDGDGFQFLANFLKRNSHVKVLRVQENNLASDLESVTQFAMALKRSISLERLEISSCDFGDDTNILGSILDGVKNKNQSILLENNNLSASGLTLLANVIASNPLLKEIHVADKVTDDVAALFSQALRANTNLICFGIRGNLSQNGKKLLSEALYDDSSLNAVGDSNHTCSLLINGEMLSGAKYTNHLSVENVNRLRKVLIAICSSGNGLVDVTHLNSVPVQFMPDVLSLIQLLAIPEYHGSDLSYVLSNVFVIMRYWNMPTLYSFIEPCVANAVHCIAKK